jgi:hypothetical protein
MLNKEVFSAHVAEGGTLIDLTLAVRSVAVKTTDRRRGMAADQNHTVSAESPIRIKVDYNGPDALTVNIG